MDKQKLSIILIVAALLLPAIKITNWPGMGIIVTVGLMTISIAFLLLFLPSKFKWGETEEEEEKNQLIITEKSMFASLSVLCVAILFTSQHWPGGSFQKLVGGLATLISAFCNIIFLNEGKCPYYFKLRDVSIAAIFLAIVGMTNFYSDFIFKKQFSDYHHLVEIYGNRDGDEEQRKERNVELLKFYDLDSKSYNHFDSLLTKADAILREIKTDAKELYLLMNQVSKYGVPLNGIVYDWEEDHAALPIDLYAELHPDFFNKYVTLIVVTDDPEKATEKLKSLSSDNQNIIIVE